MNVFTVDLEEWFHICDASDRLAPERWSSLPSRADTTTRLVLDLLDRAQVSATFFVVGWVAERHPRLIEDILAAGHEIGSHGYWHRRAYDLGESAFRADLRLSVQALREAGATRVDAFRAPEWSINNRSLWALDVLVEEGFVLDASMAPLTIVGDPSFPRGPHRRRTRTGSLVEVPPLVADRFGHVMPMGWGWGLRMSSPARVLSAIDAANRRGLGAVLAVHPWELDPDPPRTRLRPGLHFAHYFRLGGFRQRLQEVLAGARFSRLRELAV